MRCSTDKSKGILFREGKCNYSIDKRVVFNNVQNPLKKNFFGGFYY